MDPAYAAMFAALAGSLVGGLTSFLTVWFQQRAQHQERWLESDQSRRLALYGGFIREASRLYGDALTHEKDEVSDLVTLFSAVNEMRLFASPSVITAADIAIDSIVNAYLEPNVPMHMIAHMANDGNLNPLAGFADACREEIRTLRLLKD